MTVRNAKVSECPDVKNCKWRLIPVWHRVFYCCIAYPLYPYGNSGRQRVNAKGLVEVCTLWVPSSFCTGRFVPTQRRCGCRWKRSDVCTWWSVVYRTATESATLWRSHAWLSTCYERPTASSSSTCVNTRYSYASAFTPVGRSVAVHWLARW